MEISGAPSTNNYSSYPRANPASAAEPETQERAVEEQQLRQQQEEVRSLVRRDREVRRHEQAHAAAGGVHAGSPQYEFTRGSNGVSYATGGHVSIDVSDVPGDAQATLAKMQTVQRAALAPAQPSAQDRAVAAEASSKAIEARAELLRENSEKLENSGNTENNQSAAKIGAYQATQADSEGDGDGQNAASALVDAYA